MPRSTPSVQPDDLRWHVPSVQMDPADSPALARFLDHVDVVLSVHGYGRNGMFTTLLLGGADRPLADHLAGHLRAALPGYTVDRRPGCHPPAAAGPAPRQPGQPVAAVAACRSSCRPASACRDPTPTPRRGRRWSTAWWPPWSRPEAPDLPAARAVGRRTRSGRGGGRAGRSRAPNARAPAGSRPSSRGGERRGPPSPPSPRPRPPPWPPGRRQDGSGARRGRRSGWPGDGWPSRRPSRRATYGAPGPPPAPGARSAPRRGRGRRTGWRRGAGPWSSCSSCRSASPSASRPRRSTNADRRPALLVGGGQGHGFGLVDAHLDGLVPPGPGLGDGVRVEVVEVDACGQVLGVDGVEISHGPQSSEIAPILVAERPQTEQFRVQRPRSSWRVGATLGGAGGVGAAPRP